MYRWQGERAGSGRATSHRRRAFDMEIVKQKLFFEKYSYKFAKTSFLNIFIRERTVHVSKPVETIAEVLKR